jgi:hypothetical protein
MFFLLAQVGMLMTSRTFLEGLKPKLLRILGVHRFLINKGIDLARA